jgi:hypothetical protein
MVFETPETISLKQDMSRKRGIINSSRRRGGGQGTPGTTCLGESQPQQPYECLQLNIFSKICRSRGMQKVLRRLRMNLQSARQSGMKSFKKTEGKTGVHRYWLVKKERLSISQHNQYLRTALDRVHETGIASTSRRVAVASCHNLLPRQTAVWTTRPMNDRAR